MSLTAPAGPVERVEAMLELGRSIGKMYIAAQHVSQEASDAACAAMENATRWTRVGFNQVLERSPFQVKA